MPLNLGDQIPTDEPDLVGTFEAWATEQNLDLSPPEEGESGRYGDPVTAAAFADWRGVTNQVDEAE